MRTSPGEDSDSWRSRATHRYGAGALRMASSRAAGSLAAGASGSSPRFEDHTPERASKAVAAAWHSATARSSSRVTT